MSASTCPTCKGARLKPEALAVTVGGLNIDAVTRMSIETAEAFFRSSHLTRAPGADRAPDRQRDPRAPRLPHQRRARTISRSRVRRRRSRAASRSASASRRRSAARWSACSTSSTSRRSGCISATTTGCSRRCKTLRDFGNTLIVIEHDEDTMREADVIVDIGPGAGAEGGEILTVGTLDDVLAQSESQTGAYLSGRKFIPIPKQRRDAARLARSEEREGQQPQRHRRRLSARRLCRA